MEDLRKSKTSATWYQCRDRLAALLCLTPSLSAAVANVAYVAVVVWGVERHTSRRGEVKRYCRSLRKSLLRQAV